MVGLAKARPNQILVITYRASVNMVNILHVNLPQTHGKINNGVLKDKAKATVSTTC